MEAPDPRTLVLHLAWPDPCLLEKLAQPRYAIPVPAAAESAAGAFYGADPRTNGPYRLERDGAGGYRFVRNVHYSSAADSGQGADTIAVRTGVTARRALLGLESRRIDVLWPVPAAYRSRLARTAGLTTVHAALDPPIVWFLVLNAELAPLARRDARRAVALAINRERLPEMLGSGILPWRGFEPWGGAGGGGAPGYDPEGARAFLAEAKYFAGIRVPVSVPRGAGPAEALEGLVPALARASIQADGLELAGAKWSRAVVTRRGVMAAIVPWQAPARDDLDGLAALFLNRGLGVAWGGNWSWYHPSANLDSLILEGLRQSDPVARAGQTSRITTLLEAELPLVPLARVDEWAVGGPALEGLRIHSRYGLDLRRARRRGGPPGP